MGGGAGGSAVVERLFASGPEPDENDGCSGERRSLGSMRYRLRRPEVETSMPDGRGRRGQVGAALPNYD